MIIQLATLSEGIHEYNFTVLHGEIFGNEKIFPMHFSDAVTFEHPIYVVARIDKSTRQIRLQVRIQTQCDTSCDRCTDDFLFSVQGKYEVVYVFNEQHIPNADEETEYVYLSEDKLHIDLTEDVRQTLLLSVPMKLLCTEDCPGVCTQCGKNLNNDSCSCNKEHVDERWSKLQSLKTLISE